MARLTNGGIVGKQATIPTSSSASGKWNLSEQNIYRAGNIWPDAGPVLDGLILWLDPANTSSYSGSGSSWNDISGNGNHVTLYNNPTFSSGTFTFNGTNQYAATTNNINLSSASYVSVEIYFRAITANGSMLWEHTADWNTNVGGFGLAVHSNGSGFQLNTHHTNHNSWGVLNYNATIGTSWSSHLNIFSRINDSTGRQAWVNGNNISSQSVTSASFANARMFFSSRGGVGFSNYQIGEIRIYNKKLSSLEISKNFNYSRSRYGL